MKVLVISLLRLGDFIQTVPVIKGLKEQMPAREVDVLVFSPVKQMAGMVDGVSKWWTLDREGLQAGLGRADIPMLASFDVLKEKLDAIDAKKYDLIINLTQTHFSAWIAGYLRAPGKLGLVFDKRGEAVAHSPWFQYMDDNAPLTTPDTFHYTDIFYFGSGLSGGARDWRLKETTAGRLEADNCDLPAGEIIAVQMLTSDGKKNWPRASWLSMLAQLKTKRPAANFVLLGAPNEDSVLQVAVQEAAGKGLKLHKAIVSLEGALAILNRSQLLITGDTSIKHLANASKAAILELSLGSSDPRRTGAYKNNSLILQPQMACSPCAHSSPCSQASHLCAAALPVETVATAADHVASNRWVELARVAIETGEGIKFLRTRHLESGFWLAFDMTSTQASKVADTVVERCTWKFVLNREHLNPLAQFGSEGVFMQRELAKLFSQDGVRGLAPHLDFLEEQAGTAGEEVNRLLTSVKNRKPEIEQLRRFFEAHHPHSAVVPWIEQLGRDENAPVQIGGLRRVRSQLELLLQQSQVKMKLIRSLKSQLTEFL